ncbi:MAG: hypothetical protein KI790_17005 [Cyclobacteriaceae bacterium]|nr:hypothetical protein [Cyclobacteriaceae bacterium HetDA_MAG_MS6]
MPWTCNSCGKQFAKRNQWHKCQRISYEVLFSKSESSVLDRFEDLLQELSPKLNYELTTSVKALTLYGPIHKSFLVIYPRKKHIDIWFPLDRKVEEFPIFKIQQSSKRRYAHYVRITPDEPMNETVKSWISEAYHLTNPN